MRRVPFVPLLLCVLAASPLLGQIERPPRLGGAESFPAPPGTTWTYQTDWYFPVEELTRAFGQEGHRSTFWNLLRYEPGNCRETWESLDPPDSAPDWADFYQGGAGADIAIRIDNDCWEGSAWQYLFLRNEPGVGLLRVGSLDCWDDDPAPRCFKLVYSPPFERWIPLGDSIADSWKDVFPVLEEDPYQGSRPGIATTRHEVVGEGQVLVWTGVFDAVLIRSHTLLDFEPVGRNEEEDQIFYRYTWVADKIGMVAMFLGEHQEPDPLFYADI